MKYCGNNPQHNESFRHRKDRIAKAQKAVEDRKEAKAAGGEPCYKDKHCLSNWCEPQPRLICIDSPKVYMFIKSFGKQKRPNDAFCFNNYDCISNKCNINRSRDDNYCYGPYMTPEEQKQSRLQRKKDDKEFRFYSPGL
jgi:hypothetical protein